MRKTSKKSTPPGVKITIIVEYGPNENEKASIKDLFCEQLIEVKKVKDDE